MIKDMERKCVTTDEFWKVHRKVDQILHEIVHQLAERATNDLIESNLNPLWLTPSFKSEMLFKKYMRRSRQDQANDPVLWEALKPKDFTTYVSKQQQQQHEGDAWQEETVNDEDEEIPEDETPELIIKFWNVDKRVPTIFDRERMKATLNDIENDKPYSFSESDFKYLNKDDIEDLYYLCWNKKINYRETKVNLTAPTLTFSSIEAHGPYSIVDKPDTGLIYLNRLDEKRGMYLVDIVKFCDATLEKVLNEVKLRIFQNEFWNKPPLLGELDFDIITPLFVKKTLGHNHGVSSKHS
nr:hypothetical protein [Tanacetum cinerariifolium]